LPTLVDIIHARPLFDIHHGLNNITEGLAERNMILERGTSSCC